MTRSSQQMTRSSEIGGALGPNGAIDAFSLTDNARIRRIHITVPAFTQNTTVRGYAGPVGCRGIFLGGYVSFTTLPAGGVLSVNIEVYDASATAAVAIGTADPETGTARIGKALTMDVANDTLVCEPTDTLDITTIADNNAVGTAHVGGVVTLLFLPLEPADGSSARTGSKLGL